MNKQEQRIRESFARQAIMTTIGASITHIGPGEVTIELPFRAKLPSSTALSMPVW